MIPAQLKASMSREAANSHNLNPEEDRMTIELFAILWSTWVIFMAYGIWRYGP
jgi:hypothetical protein